jgi:hypothetical protein
MNRYWLILSIAALGGAAFADTSDDRSKLSGSWQAKDGSGDMWVIEENGDAIRMSNAKGAEKATEIECNTVGRECELKRDGKKGTVSIYFNGPKLVELETRGSEVVKRRFAVTQNGDTLEVEVIPVVPDGNPKKLDYVRAPNRASK